MNQPAMLQEDPDFSLVLGGPMFQLFRRTHLTGNALELLHRRIVGITLIAWLPLLVLSLIGGSALGSGVTLPFLRDIETQVRFLIAVPALLAAELVVHLRLRPTVQNFVKRNIVDMAQIPKFRAAIDSATRVRNSIPLELGLMIAVYTVGGWHWRHQVALSTSSWYAIPQGGSLHFTPAGYWYAFISVPIFQFILLRWYLRLIIWIRFLWQVSRLDLHLVATHPDRSGGLAFLGKSSYAFGPILFAQGAILSGLIASRVLYEGRSLLSFKMEAIGLIVLFLLFIFGPLMMFTPQMARAKRKGLSEYGQLASRYVDEFEAKWVVRSVSQQDELMGAADIQSLADLGNSYAVVREMRPVPFGLEDMTRLTIATAAPLVPLGLTIFSFEELLTRVIKIIFEEACCV